jgi:peptide/nickel transport system permease protein
VSELGKPPAPKEPAELKGISYWAIVVGQLKRNKVAIFGFWAIVWLLFVAIYTPVIASDRPFYYSGPEGTSWPWFADMFDRLAVPTAVDLFFNLAMLFVPIGFVVFLVVRSILRRRDTWGAKPLRRTLTVVTLLFLWTFAGIVLPDSVVKKPFWKVAVAPGLVLRSSKPVIDYHARLTEHEKEGKEVTAYFPPVAYSYKTTRLLENTRPPDWFKGFWSIGRHPLGTDPGGVDVFATLLYGTRISMTIGVIAVSIYVTIGIILGSLAGYFGGWVDILISRFIEIMICFPLFFFVIFIVAVFEKKSIFLIMAAIGIAAWTGVARLVRGEFLTQRGREYAIAATALGIPKRRIIFRHILPNALTPVFVAATFGVAAAILTESGLAFLGLGDPGAASWGMLLNKGRLSNLEWVILAPGVAIFFTVTVFNLLGEGLRDALDPKLRE